MEVWTLELMIHEWSTSGSCLYDVSLWMKVSLKWQIIWHGIVYIILCIKMAFLDYNVGHYYLKLCWTEQSRSLWLSMLYIYLRSLAVPLSLCFGPFLVNLWCVWMSAHCNVKLGSFFWFVQPDSGLRWYSFTRCHGYRPIW